MERTKKEYKDVSFDDMYSEERKRAKYINNSIISQLNFYNQTMNSSQSQFNDSSSNITSNTSSDNNRLKRSEDYLTSDENKKYTEEYRVLTSITTKENAQVNQKKKIYIYIYIIYIYISFIVVLIKFINHRIINLYFLLIKLSIKKIIKKKKKKKKKNLLLT